MAGSATLEFAAPLLVLPVAVPILLLALIGGQSSATPGPCRPGLESAQASSEDLDADQMHVATQIVAAVQAFGPTANKPHAAVIALATARQESGIRNLDRGDRDSLGAFQQRPSQGWGTPAEVMNVPHATTTFLKHLVLVRDWETRRVTDVAADVQRPAEEYRGLYEQWVPLATHLTEQLWGTAYARVSGGDCGPASAGSVVYPVPAQFNGADRHNWGGTGDRWSRWHTGTDFSVPCGTPMRASTSGRVEIDRGQPWAGRWLVKVVSGPTSVATWYAHMQKLAVTDGQVVTAGQQIGEAGDLGNATGCHLHFEVHLHNGSIYGPDNVDPSRWLVAHARSPNAA